MKYKLLWIVAIFFLINISIAMSVEFENEVGDTFLTNDATCSNYDGVWFDNDITSYIVNITRLVGNNYTSIIVLDNNRTIIGVSYNLTGETFYFPSETLYLYAGMNYSLSINCSENDASHYRLIWNEGGYPLAGNSVTWRGRIDGGNYLTDAYVHNFRTMITSNTTGPPPSVNVTPEFINATPSDITTTNLIGNNLTLVYNISTENINETYISYMINSSFGGGDYWVVVNGSIDKGGYVTDDFSYTNTTDIFTFLADGDNLLPATYLLDEDLFKNTTHNVLTLENSNRYAMINFYNVSNSVENNLLEMMLNSSGTCEVFYCNSSYTSGVVSTSSFCEQFATGVNPSFNHSHSANSKHNIFALPFNATSGQLGSVYVTSDSKIIVRGSPSGQCDLGYIDVTTRPDTIQYSSTSGNSWNNQIYTIDAHIHQYSTSDNIVYTACAVNSTGTFCDSFQSDTFDLTIFPPTSPSIITPAFDSDIYRLLNISYSSSIPYGNATLKNYSIDLLNNDLTYNRTIINNNLSNSYLWDIINAELELGNYYIKVTAYDDNGLNNSDQHLVNVTYNALLNISAFNSTNKIINYTVNVTGLNDSSFYSVNGNDTNNGSVAIDVIYGYDYFLFLDAEGFAYANATKEEVNYSDTMILYAPPENSVNITVRDESSYGLVTQNITVVFSLVGGTQQYIIIDNTGYFLFEGISAGNYTVSFTSITPTVYTVRTYNVMIGERSTQFLQAFLNSGTDVLFTYSDITSGDLLEDVGVSMYRIINSSWTLVETRATDITGRVQFSFVSNIKYQFISSLTGYEPKTFELDPILFTSYNVKMSKTATLPEEYTDVFIYTTPTKFYDDKENYLDFRISSFQGVLTYYEYTLRTRYLNYSWNGTNLNGGTDLVYFNLTNNTLMDKVYLDIYYETSEGITNTLNYSYNIITGARSNYTFMDMLENDYGMGLLEKILIITFLAIVIGGVVGFIGGPLPAIVMVMFIFGYFLVIGFIPFYSVAIPLIIGAVLLFSGSGRQQ